MLTVADERPPFGWPDGPPGSNGSQFHDEYGGPCGEFDDNRMPGNIDMNGSGPRMSGPMQGPGQRGPRGPVPLLGGPEQIRPAGGTGQMPGTRPRGPGPMQGPGGPGPRGSMQGAGPRGPGPEPWQGPGGEQWQREPEAWQQGPAGPMQGPDMEQWQGPGPRHQGPGAGPMHGPGQFGPRGPGPGPGPGFHPAEDGNEGQFGRWPQRQGDMDGPPPHHLQPDHPGPFRAPGSSGPLRPPSLLDLPVKPPVPKGTGMKRKWEPGGGPLIENEDMPPMDVEGPPGPGQFGHPPDLMGPPGAGFMQPEEEMPDGPSTAGKGFSRIAPTLRGGPRGGHRGMRGGRGR